MDKEKIKLKDTIEAFKEIIKDAERIHSGNVSHQKVHIIGTAKWWLNKISKQTTETNTSEKTNEFIPDVSKRLFTLNEAQEMYFAGHINPFTEKELLEKDKNGMSVKFLETVKRCYF